jgi:adenine-specific DNA-methyltransferase
LHKKGLFPGHPEYEKNGIFELACRPRCEAAITGKRPDAVPVPGTYMDGRPFAEGFEENVEFFRLDYLNPDNVELGDSLDALHPLLWLRAGARRARPKKLRPTNGFVVVADGGYAVLLDEKAMPELIAALNENGGVDHVYLRTDSDDAYAEMCELLGRGVTTERLYGEYLAEFRPGVSLGA